MGRKTRTPATAAASALLLAVAGFALVAPALGDHGNPTAGGELVVESTRSGGTTFAGKAADGPKFFKLEVSVEGEFTADYGEHPGPNQSDYSGKASTSYSSDIVSVARWRPGEKRIDGKFANTKGRAVVTETTSVVSHFPGSPDSEFVCDNGQGSQAGGTLASAAGSPGRYVRDVATVGVRSVGDGNKAIGYGMDGPYFESHCFDAGHDAFNHYLISPNGPGVLGADTFTISDCCVIPRGAFNPSFDRGYEETYSRNVTYDSGENPHPGPFPIHPGSDPHEFNGTSSASVEISQLSEKKAERLRKKIHKLGEDQN